jgi:glyoxylase-like metal-dependent hydrolase (beta-lactamase superfamily II)
VNALAPGLSWIDLHFLGKPHAIATAVVAGAGGSALVDPGPASCRDALELGLQRQGVQWGGVTHILLTHIHLDHAGVTGSLVRDHPHVRVLVHENGARHMKDPAKLVASATRLWGADMDRLWGEILPVPQASLEVLRGGERVDAGGRTFEVAYTPGHASHHVSYFDASSGVAFVGDTAGVAIDGGYVLPPTPPPDIDLEAWAASVARIEAWSPASIFMTHFGPVSQARPHLRALLDNLSTTASIVRDSLAEEGTDEERSHRFAERLRREMRRTMSDAQLETYGVAAQLNLLWFGLARYWRKRGVGAQS